MEAKKIEEAYGQVSRALGWATDKQVSLAVTMIYLSRGREFDADAHHEVSQLIKKKEGFMSPLRAHLHHIVAAYLVLGDEPAEDGLVKLNANQQALNDVKFWKSSYTYLAGLMMKSPGEAECARELYDAMKTHHPFLTSSEDIPYVVLLSNREGDIQERAETMNRYYKELRPQGFSAGNHLQWLSQSMTFGSPAFQPEVAGRVIAIRDFLKAEKIKVRGEHYPVLGFLAIAEADGEALAAVVKMFRELEASKLFRWYGWWVLPSAVQLTMAQSVGLRESEASVFAASVELLMQAQQAAMMLGMSAVIASSNNSGS
ncbi:DUF4003 family protein [Planococcus maitriensis]|uniref:DUF4003 domain-containing protein n=1 Tax=Planococcus maitriensis TaxID=221799 RepID=A0A365K5Y3_9BACL|nr:DUF4003 family protein [Planococcus maitriensis]RAZ67909.1 hypothetical protein DP119_09715 [Planococcus maitriensis]